jgi:hypothetical protein
MNLVNWLIKNSSAISAPAQATHDESLLSSTPPKQTSVSIQHTSVLILAT